MAKASGEKFKQFDLTGSQAQVLLALLRRSPHPDSQSDNALEIIETIEAAGIPKDDVDDEDILERPYEFTDEVLIVVSVGTCEYLKGTFFRQLKVSGAILKLYRKIKHAINNAETVFDKQLLDDGWERTDGIWAREPGPFPPKDGPTDAAEESEVPDPAPA